MNQIFNTYLALDTATHCGYCTSKESGCWDFTVKQSKKNPQHPYSKLANFQDTLNKFLDDNPQIDTIVSERVSGLFKNAIISLAEMLGIIKLTCYHRGLNHIEYTSTEMKKFATGKGNAKKPEMIAAAQAKFGVTSNNDNECDAVIMYHYHIHKSITK